MARSPNLEHPGAGGPVFGAPGQSFFILVTSDNAGPAELAPDDPSTQVICYLPAP
ncbi:hypothetical protein OpiT1DRAFT_05185 [Opitutaceae bacterium TAV1]|nr:hypothetical protein OpiT1DRAFT_05185 [Opitutaceae bacterium TAV1]